MTRGGVTVLGNVRRQLDSCLENIPRYVDADNNDARSVARRTGDSDWELQCVPFSPECPRLLRELDQVLRILKHQVLPPLREILSQFCQSWTGQCLPPDVLNEIFLFAVPHYEEAVTHNPYYF